MTESKEQKYESFLMLYQTNEKHIFRFILALLPNYAVAEDIMQETMLVMWKKYDQYKQGTSFAAWGMQIARFSVLQFHRKNKHGVVRFDSEILDKIVEHEIVKKTNETEYFDALKECTQKLAGNSKEMISLRYVESMKVVDIAKKVGKSLDATYQIMSRLHRSLLACVEQKIAER